MIRMTRLTDYGVVLLTEIAREGYSEVHTARDLAEAVKLPLPTVNKVLKTLTRNGLLDSHRGVKGGYSLARRPEEITVLDVITATEGPIALTECTVDLPGNCEHEAMCTVGGVWQTVNQAIRDALAGISLAQMVRPAPPLVLLRGPEQNATTG